MVQSWETSPDMHLLHAQVPCRRGLTGAASDGGHRQAAEEEVHGGQQRFQKTDRTESRASVRGKVDFIRVRARWQEKILILTSRPGGKEIGGVLRKSPGFCIIQDPKSHNLICNYANL